MTTNAAHRVETIAMTGGFADPVRHSQTVFRAVMDALARPGSLMEVAAPAAPPPPLTPAAGALALTLADQDTAIWLDRQLQAEPAVAAWLSFQTGARIADYAGDADFAFIADAARLSLENFSQGSQEYPDRSTTLIVQVPALTHGPRLALTGPGIETEAGIAPKGLPEHFLLQWAANRARFPRGVDMVLLGPEGMVGLPRTVVIEAKEA